MLLLPDINTTFNDVKFRRTGEIKRVFYPVFSLSRTIRGRVMLCNASEFFITDPEKAFYRGKLVTVKILR